MNLREDTSEEEVTPRPEQFRYVKTPGGAKAWAGWVAAKPYWCKAHTSDKGSKPCLKWITNGALPCPRCSPTNKPTRIAYVAIYRESDLHPGLVVCHESTEDLLVELHYGLYVMVQRELGDTSSVAVRRAMAQKPFSSRKSSRQREADLTLSLLTMWKITELTSWYESKFGAPHQSTPKQEATPKQEKPASVAKVSVNTFPEKAGHELTPGEAVEARRVFDYILQREQKTNGKKKRQEE